MMRTICAVLAIFLVLGASAPALADEASEAQLQYELGVELYRQRRYGEALERFLASNRLVPNANVVYNVAQTYALLRRPVDAYNAYTTYLQFDTLDEAARDRGERARDALLPQVAVFAVSTDPPGAELFLDRVDLGSVGRAPRRIATTPGTHAVIARFEGHRETSASGEAARGAVRELAIALPPILGTLIVETTPPGARVSIQGDGTVLGTTPLRVQRPIGEPTLLVELEEHVAQTRVAPIRDGAETRIAIALERGASLLASLSVAGTEGARVELDGEALGVVPLALVDLEPGTRRIHVEQEGRVPWDAEIALEASAATRVEVSLEPPPERPIDVIRFFGYGLGGAALIAGASIGGLAVTERDAFFQSPTRDRLDAIATLNATADALWISGLALVAITLVTDLAWPSAPTTRARVTLDR